MRNRVVCAVALLGLVFSFAASAQQNVPDIQSIERMARAGQERQDALAAVAADRAAFVGGIVASWSDYASQAGFTSGWWAELEQTLNMLPDDRLVEAKKASSYQELRAIIFGRSAAAFQQITTAAPVDPLLLGSDTTDLVYTPVTPCRIVDTRGAAAGALTTGTARSFFHHDSATGGELVSQGGNAAGCGIPTDPAALALNVTAVGASVTGWMSAWAYMGTKPTASVLNFWTPQAIANTTIVPMCQICGADFTVQADAWPTAGVTHLLVDVLGYFWSPIATPLDVVSVTNSVSVGGGGGTWDIVALCPAGRTVTGGGVDVTGLPTGVFVAQNSANGTGTAWQSRGINNSAGSVTVTVQARCGRVPGR